MTSIKIEINGKKKDYSKGISILEIVKQDFADQENMILAAKVDGEVVDLSTKLSKDSNIELLTFKDEEGKEVFWHSASHLMTQAVLRVFKDQDIGLGVGFPVEDGFYQDYGMKPLHPEDLKKIEREMKQIAHEKLEIKKRNISKKEALEFYKKDPFKTELANDVEGDVVSMYSQGEFDNLCKGPHIPNTKMIKALKLTKVAGAYWRGDAKKKQLQRIYGIAFPDKEQLKDYLYKVEEAQKRDHRKLGKDLDLFSFNDSSPGSPFFHPKGAFIYLELQNFLRSLYNDWGYQEVITPLLYHKDLWEVSGHWKHYKDDMFIMKMDGQEASLKPMNCPSHILIYKTKIRSYNDLPIRITDFAPLHRNELKGVLGGLTRVRKFSQDDCHVFCTPEQIKDEIKSHISHVQFIYKEIFGFDFSVELSTRPEKSMGTDKQWKDAEQSLKEAIESCKVEYKINPGDGAFYGPKIDFHIKDCLGRDWQCATEQLDFQMPESFKISYEGSDGKKHRAVMLHRTVLGSLERFIGILIEHFAGKFPLWIAPTQVRLLTVSNKFDRYALNVKEKLEKHNMRVDFDSKPDSLPKKVRHAQLEKIPLIVTIGEKEEKDQSLAVRTLDGTVKYDVKINDFVNVVLKLIEEKSLEIKI
ncbi:MAG: threonine--tRNA ligase [Candidatus Woesearchaeota archaeon]|jgi:threonyl-tRNA synthetase|nr:threonine--tRNA ligase [Candidatus Woesearchaeota archaeon]MDP7458583.1 threonine--tRNA ligase [Candidatus Woesearchaeota archaeon]